MYVNLDRYWLNEKPEVLGTLPADVRQYIKVTNQFVFINLTTQKYE